MERLYFRSFYEPSFYPCNELGVVVLSPLFRSSPAADRRRTPPLIQVTADVFYSLGRSANDFFEYQFGEILRSKNEKENVKLDEGWIAPDEWGQNRC
ncbi:hypothetical protein GWI33_016938 [Rhynchophorus ferrugineus]|uniref:Uncharacterized protein n=1 Tax=Rhynchophorus ferrugineus TaxID=354439 RepID=A0A834HX23_RHYFE|nr:hypothetical protein GWI33_016938 [Rhynchophorus ferrugineus]